MIYHLVARTEHVMLNNYTDHEGQRTGVNVGMVDTAVLLVCIFPVGRTFMLLAEFLRSSSIASQAAEKERNLYIHSSIPTTETSTWGQATETSYIWDRRRYH